MATAKQPLAGSGRPGSATGRWTRLRRQLGKTAWLRRASQVGFAGFIAYVGVRFHLVGEAGTTVASSVEAFCPFGGLETLYTFATTAGLRLQHTHPSNLIVLAALLATALVARGAFCGWICPFGAFQDALRAVGGRVLGERDSVRHGRTYWGGGRLPDRATAALVCADRWLRYARYLVLAFVLVQSARLGYMVFRDFDPFAALTLAEQTAVGGVVALSITALLALAIDRPWCRYACRLGAAVATVGKLSPTAIERNAALCTDCNLCNAVCPVAIDVAHAARVTDGQCALCQTCVDACPVKALGVTARAPAPGPAGWRRRVNREGVER
jgi:polyferredoxin